MDRRTFLKSSALTLGALATGCTAGLGSDPVAASALALSSPQTYKLGRLSVTVPDFMQPRVEKFSYTWDSRTPNNESHYLGYPLSLSEQPYINAAHAEAEWHDAVDTVRNENHCGLLFEGFEWDASSQFKVPAYFFCFKGDGATYQFYIIIQESQCLLHIVGRKSYRYPAQPEKDALTEEILQILTEFYKKYRQGHNIHRGNIFYTYYGEIIDVIFNTNERMSVQFSNTEKDLLWGINTSINFSGETENDLRNWMKRGGRPGFSRARMRDIPNFPGKGYETLEKNNNTSLYFLELDYAGLYLDTHIPSFHMFATKKSSVDMDTFLEMWEVILADIRPLQQENFRSTKL